MAVSAADEGKGKSMLRRQEVDAAARTPKGDRRRSEILAAALAVFCDRGYEGTSHRAIAAHVGVTHAALKHYFPSREELLLEVLREGGDGKEEQLATLRTWMLGRALEQEQGATRSYLQGLYADERAEVTCTEQLQPAMTETAAAVLIAIRHGLLIQERLGLDVDTEIVARLRKVVCALGTSTSARFGAVEERVHDRSQG